MLDPQFNSETVETAARARWQERDFTPQRPGAPAFCLMLPPPNVTGTLHMGHGFQHTLMDVVTRYSRMCGDNALWQPGTDHAGIATQMVVERQLERQDLTRQALGREAFLAKVWAWKAESGGTIASQMRVLGDSVDWSRERFTMDEGLSAAVIEAFVRLHRDGLIYRGKRLVNWDPVLLTAVSDLEVIASEEQGSLWHLRYPLLQPQGELTHVVVATTRPETLLGDVAVAVHPEDPRYAKLIGQKVRLPLTERDIPIIADAYVDPAFGSGCVKITPAHDFNDYEMAQRHDLPLINLFHPNACLNEQAPERYRGLTREVARQQVLAELSALGLLEKTEPHTLKVPRSERSGVIVEPYLTEQWYVKMADLAPPALAAVEDGKIEFVPDNWRNTYRQWLDNIQDWCISRQLWWGHRIPAWYDTTGSVYVGYSEIEVRQHYALADDVVLRQDEDVLDTWFSAALWPFSTLGWPEKTLDLATFYPNSLLVTGFDIIFFWVARMVMFGLHFLGEVPFKKVLFTGLIRDSEGQKMSKSKGNVLDPLDLINGITLDALIKKRTANLMIASQIQTIEAQTRKQFPNGIAAYGVDALRFTFCALATHGRDIRFDLGRIEGYRNFCNKLWNATRFIQMQLEQHGVTTLVTPINESALAPVEQWILTRLNATVRDAHQAIKDLRFDWLAQCLYEFVWNDFCDWYIEFAKISLNGTISDDAKRQVLTVLVTVLERIYRLLHPIIPFITETLWQSMAPILRLESSSLALVEYPQVQAGCSDPAAVKQVEWLQAWVGAIRQLRSEYKIAPGARIAQAHIKPLTSDMASVWEKFSLHNLFKCMAKVNEDLNFLPFNAAQKAGPRDAAIIVGAVEIILSLEGLIDFAAERERAYKELLKYQAEVVKIGTKLANEDYVNKAPAAVVAKERERLSELKSAIIRLKLKVITEV